MFKVISRAAIVQIAAYFVSTIAFSSQALAQAEVVDPVPIGGNNTRSTYNAAAQQTQAAGSNGAAQLSSEFYYQFQVLQQEVMDLRGLVEEQAHEIKKLKQQRLDDYLDLDRRIGELRGGGGASAGGSSALGSSAGSGSAAAINSAGTSAAAPAPADELQRYRDAIDLLLKQQDQDGAIAALNKHLEDYPRGRYAANAQYWLGETYLLKGNLDLARKWFSQLISEFPNHNKVPDAKFKLAKVYDSQGDKDKARQLLEEVAQSGTSAAGLARDYLGKL